MVPREDAPGMGDWVIPKDGSAPGLVVAVLPDATKVIIANRPAPTYEVVERVYAVKELKGYEKKEPRR